MQIPAGYKTLLLLTLAFLSFAAKAQTAAQADRVTARVDASARAQIAGHVPAWIAARDVRIADAGPVPDAQSITLMFGVSRSPQVQTAFDQLLADLQNPASPRYHQFLTPQQIGEQFGPTQHDLDALTVWLTGAGFHVDSITPSRISVQVTAPAAVVSSALGTSLHNYARTVAGKTDMLQAPTAEPSVPAALAPIVATIGGLVNVPLHTNLKAMPPVLNTQTNVRTPETLGQARNLKPDMTLGAGEYFITPADFTVIYDLQPTYSASYNGSGQKIMIIGGSQLYSQDIEYWEHDTGLSSSLTSYYTPNYIVPTGLTNPGVTQDDNMGEGTLDFERSYGTAPGATIDMVIGSNWLNGTVSTQLITYAINTVNDPILTMSFGSCEYYQGSANVQAENTLYAQAAAQGISVFASSGDTGVAGCEGVVSAATQIASISDICATGNLTCVGGTEFADTANPSLYWSSTNSSVYESALSYIPEGAWNDPSYVNTNNVTVYEFASTGGGPSTNIAKPSWQAGVGVPADGHRDVPDMSFSASAVTPYFICLNYSQASCVPNAQGQFYLTGFGGTSATAPSMAGVTALLDQKFGKRQGNLNPMLYSLSASTPSAFHDATPATSGIGSSCNTAVPSMCNNSDPTTSSLTGGLAGYALTTGYDMTTGLGSLDVSKFITAAFTASSLLTPTITVSATPNPATTAQTVVVKVTVASTTTGTPSGTVVLTSNGTTLATLTLSGGTASTAALSFPTIGTYTIVATYSGDTVFGGVASVSYPLVITATGTTKSSSLLTATAAAATTVQTAGFTATVSGSGGTPTGTVQFTLDSANYGMPVALAGGVATVNPAPFKSGIHQIGCTYSGDNTFASSSCNTVTLTITSLTSSTSISIVPTSVGTTGTTTIGGIVTGVAGAPVPTGTITLYNLTTNTNYGYLTLSGGSASSPLPISSALLVAGNYQFDLVYSGDNVYGTSTSPQATLTVLPTTVTMSPQSASITQTAGGSSTDVVTLTSSNFTGTQTLTCIVTFNGPGTASDLPGCTFLPATVTFTGSGTNTATVTVSSTAAALVKGGVYQSENRRLDLTGAGGAAFAGLLLLCLPQRGRSSLKAVRLVAAMLFLVAGFATLSGCGSGSASNPGTTKGSYDLNISANSALNQAGNVGYSTVISLTIQ